MGQPPHTDNSATSQPCASLEISNVFFFSPPISAQMSRCMYLCVCLYIAPFTKTFAPMFFFFFLAAQQRRKRPVSWNSFPLTFFLSHRPLPVLLDICIRHSFESHCRSIKVFSVPLNPTLEEKCVPRRHWDPNHKGKIKELDQNKQTGGENSEAVVLFFFGTLNFAFVWMNCISLFFVCKVLSENQNYCTTTSSIFREHPLWTETK